MRISQSVAASENGKRERRMSFFMLKEWNIATSCDTSFACSRSKQGKAMLSISIIQTGQSNDDLQYAYAAYSDSLTIYLCGTGKKKRGMKAIKQWYEIR